MPRLKATCLRNNLLTTLTVVGVLGGVFMGIILRQIETEDNKWTQRDMMYLQFPGEIFLQMLKALIIPLLVSSVVTAVGSLDLSLSKKIAFRAIFYYSITTLLAVTLGIILVLTIRPGGEAGKKYQDIKLKKIEVRKVLTADTILDLIRNLFPPNMIQSTLSQSQTTLLLPENGTNETSLEDYKIVHSYEGSTNFLGLVVFGIALGISLGILKEKGRPLLQFFEALSEAMMVITGWVIWISPIGVFFLVAEKILNTESFSDLVGALGMYFVTVLLGLLLHGFGSLAVIFFVCTRTLPFRFIASLSQVLVTAFGTASSSATLPLTIQTLDKLGLDPRVTRFVIPVGAQINMDGTALYEAVAALFIAQFRAVDFSFGKVVAVSITATAASVGAAGIPQAGLVTMVMVLEAVGLPATDGALIIAVDWLLDRFRTTINVMGDSMGAKIVDVLSKGELDRNALDRELAAPHELLEITKASSNI